MPNEPKLHHFLPEAVHSRLSALEEGGPLSGEDAGKLAIIPLSMASGSSE